MITIENKDIEQIVVNRDIDGDGDNASIYLQNPNRKYNALINKDARLSSFFRLYSGYDAHLVPIFTGRSFVIDVEHGDIPEKITIKLLDRNSFLERASMTSDFYSNKTVTELITEFAEKYFGYSSGEIIIDSVFSTYTIPTFVVNDEPPIRKLRDIVKAFGGRLYTDAYGNLCVKEIYSKTVVDMTYQPASVISYGFNITGIQDRFTDIEVIGKERSLDEIVNTDVRNCLGYQVMPIISIPTPHISQSFKTHMKGSIFIEGLDYNPESMADPKISLLAPFNPSLEYGLSGWSPRDFVIVNLPHEGVKAMPYNVDIKELTPKIVDDQGNTTEYWQYTSAYSVDILGFSEDSTQVRISGYSETDPRILLISLWGYCSDEKYIIKKSYVLQDGWRVYPVYEETKAQFLTHYYAKLPVTDTETGYRMSQILGANNKKSFNLDWVNSDSLAKTICQKQVIIEETEAYKFHMIVPRNPLIEVGDLIRLNLDNPVDFWVKDITHTEGVVSTTELKGVIKNVADKPWE